MRTICYLCLATLLAAVGLDFRQCNQVIATDNGGRPLQFSAIVEAFTIHDRIPIRTFAFGWDSRQNGAKWDGPAREVLGNPNLFTVITADGLHLNRVKDGRWEETLRIDREREDRIEKMGAWVSLTGPVARYIYPPNTNWTTVAEIIGQRIADGNYVVVAPEEKVIPPGLKGHPWVIQATLNPQPPEWPVRVQPRFSTNGYWHHLGAGKYAWIQTTEP